MATYGQIARLAGFPNQARLVGYALHALNEGTDVPWHRVINVQGKISQHSDPEFVHIQQKLLESEGIVFDNKARMNLKDFQWNPNSTES